MSDMPATTRSPPAAPARHARIVRGCGWTGAGIGALALIGWLSMTRILSSVLPGSIPMAPNTALAFMMLGSGLVILPLAGTSRPWRSRLPGCLATIVAAVALLRLLEYVLRVDLGVDGWIVRVPGEQIGLAPVGKMAFFTAIGFILASASLLLAARPRPRPADGDVIGALGLTVSAEGLVFSLGYLYGAPLLAGAPLIPMALNSALSFLMLGVGLVFVAGPGSFPLRPLSENGTRGELLRTFLPFSVLAVSLVAWLTFLLTTYSDPSNAPLFSALASVAAILGVALLSAPIARRMGARLAEAEACLKQTEEQLRQAQKLEAIGRLAGGIAHDFNNLLTVITGYSEIALATPSLDKRVRTSVEEVRKAGERAASLTRQLLAFSRRQVLQPEVLDLNAVVSDMDRMIRRLIGADVDVRTVLAPDLGSVNVDPGQMEQVLLNLVVNARDAMPDGGKLTIETANVELGEDYRRKHPEVTPGPHVMMAVSDSGHGMTTGVLGRMFEPFFTTKDKGKGTGLGLATVYGIVKQSEGSIWVYSEPGRGATFKVFLPRVFATPAPRLEAGVCSPDRGSETIVLVEDEASLRSLISEVLRTSGYTVLEASTGTEALGICKQREGMIHLVIADLVMPEMGGVELVRTLAGNGCTPRVLFISGYTETAALHQQAVPEGAAFLQKPFGTTALTAKVREVLGASNLAMLSS